MAARRPSVEENGKPPFASKPLYGRVKTETKNSPLEGWRASDGVASPAGRIPLPLKGGRQRFARYARN